MYFTKIRLNGISNIDLPIVGAKPSDRFILKNGSGLGPPEVDVSITNTLNSGGYYQGRRPHPRQIVLHVGLNPDYKVDQTVYQLRKELYGLLTPGLPDIVRVDLMDKEVSVAYSTGYVSKLEITPFSQSPEAQITMECLEQYFLAPAPIYLNMSAVPDFGLVYGGSAPAGFYMHIYLAASMSSFKLTDDGGGKMELVYNFLQGDWLIIDTRPGYRKIELIRGAVTYNLLHSLTADSIWHMLHAGAVMFHANTSAWNWQEFFYQPQYWGI